MDRLFSIKIISKVLGMLYLDFEKLYWLVFLLGDPMTCAVILLSIYMVRKQYKKDRPHNAEADGTGSDVQEKAR